MRRQHENADHLMPGEGWALMDGTPMPDAIREQLRCLDCGAWLPLGPANDRGVPVIELMLAWSMSMAGEDGDDESESYAAGEWSEGMLMAVARERGLIGDRSQRKQRTRRRGR